MSDIQTIYTLEGAIEHIAMLARQHREMAESAPTVGESKAFYYQAIGLETALGIVKDIKESHVWCDRCQDAGCDLCDGA